MFTFSQRSLNNLKGVHPDLVKVLIKTLQDSEIDFAIIEGLRTLERQKEMVAQGKSQTMQSRHLTGHAIDFMAYVDSVATWEVKYYKQISDIAKKVSQELNIPIIWGGDWKTLKDDDHIELDPTVYKD